MVLLLFLLGRVLTDTSSDTCSSDDPEKCVGNVDAKGKDKAEVVRDRKEVSSDKTSTVTESYDAEDTDEPDLEDDTSEGGKSEEEDDSERIGGVLEDLGATYADYYSGRTSSSSSTAMGAKFRNFINKRVYKYWDDGSEEGVYNGFLEPLGFGATNTYETHTFIYRDDVFPKGKEVARHTMRKGQYIYLINPEEEWVKETQEYKDTMEEKAFMENYYREHGLPWLSEYPRMETLMPMWGTRYIGQTHHIHSDYGYVTCGPIKRKGCLDNTPLDLKLRVASIRPKVLVIENLMSHFECDHILNLAKPRFGRSSVGHGANSFQTKTRTSRTSWLKRTQTKIMDHIFSRFADVLDIPNDVLTHDRCAENLQVVEYHKRQEYAPHHDFGSDGKNETRYATLLLYITDYADGFTVDDPHGAGGHTGFPKAFGGRGLRVRPPKGSGVLFYSLLPDGNSDDMSLHAGMPVIEGTKYICNLWVWDPSRNGRLVYRAKDNHYFDDNNRKAGKDPRRKKEEL